MMDIQIGVVGALVPGHENERYIKIVDDTDGSGGFLILTADDPDMQHGFDSWVKDRAELEGYFKESNYTVDWTPNIELAACTESCTPN